MNLLSGRCDQLQGKLGATKEDVEVARHQAQELEHQLSECQERLVDESAELAKVHPQQSRVGLQG